jgi:hypothetical protein
MKSIIEEEDVEDKPCVSTQHVCLLKLTKEVSGSNVGSPDALKSLVAQICAIKCLKLTRKRITKEKLRVGEEEILF